MDTAMQWPTNGNPQSVFVDDISGYRETLRLNSERIFVGQDELDIEACILTESRCTAKKLCNFKELQAFLDEAEDSSITDQDGPPPAASIFFVRQQHSRARMAISEPAMMLLLCRLQVFPAFVNIITSFGLERGPYTDGYSSFYAKIARDKSEALVFETAYMLKYVECHGRPDTIIPWSIRQMGVYQRYNVSTKLSSCVLIQTSDRVQKRIFELVDDGHIARFPYHWTFLHIIYLGTLSNKWTAYIKLLDSKIEEIDLEVRFAKLGSDNPDRVTFTDLQQLNKLSDLLIRVIHALQLNLDVFKMLSREASERVVVEGDELLEQYDEFQGALRTCSIEHTFLMHHASLVRENAERIATQLRDTIALQDSNATLTMTHKTIQEARTMKTITFVALIFLPASFVCTFLSMGFVHVESLGGVMQLSADKDMWLFLAIAAPLMLATFLGWWLWEFKTRRTRKKRENGEKYKDV